MYIQTLVRGSFHSFCASVYSDLIDYYSLKTKILLLQELTLIYPQRLSFLSLINVPITRHLLEQGRIAQFNLLRQIRIEVFCWFINDRYLNASRQNECLGYNDSNKPTDKPSDQTLPPYDFVHLHISKHLFTTSPKLLIPLIYIHRINFPRWAVWVPWHSTIRELETVCSWDYVSEISTTWSLIFVLNGTKLCSLFPVASSCLAFPSFI